MKPCIEGEGSTCAGGYLQVRLDGRLVMEHRAVYEYLVGPIPDGMELDHLCGNRSCVRPDHLEPVTRQENIRRSSVGHTNREKTHCVAGHPLSGDNLYLPPGRLHRQCRTCKMMQKRKGRA